MLNPKHLSYFTPSLPLPSVLLLPQSCFSFSLSFIICSAAASPAGPCSSAGLRVVEQELSPGCCSDSCDILGSAQWPEPCPGGLRISKGCEGGSSVQRRERSDAVKSWLSHSPLPPQPASLGSRARQIPGTAPAVRTPRSDLTPIPDFPLFLPFGAISNKSLLRAGSVCLCQFQWL